MSVENQTESLASQTANIAMAVSFYWATSISMVFANKTLLGGQERSSAPFFITWTQCVITVLFCYVAGALQIARVPPFEVKRDILKQMVSLSFVFTSMIAFNNLCLKYVEVSFYQVARSLTIVFTVILEFIVLGQTNSINAILCCAIVVSGFALGNVEELRWSLLGVIFGVTSSFFVALNSIVVKNKLALVDNNPWKITLYNNINASFLFLPLIFMSGEIPFLASSEETKTLKYWGLLLVSGLLGVGISFATAAQIKYTSPLSHNVSATAKAATQTVIALLVYRNPITHLGALAVLIVLGASLGYTLVRRAEMKKRDVEETAAKRNVEKESLVPQTEVKADAT